MRLIQRLLFAFAVCGLGAGGANATPTAPVNGSEYQTLAQAQNTDAGDKVEVIEFFSYSCPHCNRFEPVLAAWVKQNAAKIVFKRVHVAFNGGDVPLQRMYLSAESMGLADKLHPQVFAAIHGGGERLNSDEQVFDWIEKHGVERVKFMGVYRSFGANSWVNRAQATIRAYNIDQWPMIAINGRYLTAPYFTGRGNPSLTTETQQQQATLQVMDVLLAKAKAEKK